MKTAPAKPGYMRVLLKRGLSLMERMQAWDYIARSTEWRAALEHLHNFIETTGTAEELEEARAKYEARLAELCGGPARPAVVVAPRTGVAGLHPRAICCFEDGSEAAPHVPDAALAATLEAGDQVLVDMRALAIIGLDGARPGLGETMTLEKVQPDGQLQVSSATGDSITVMPVRGLRDRIVAGTVAVGARLVASARQRVAFAHLPETDGQSHHQFLDKTPPADVVIERDIGCPAPMVAQILQHVRLFLHHAEVLQRFRRAKSMSWLATGRPGTGKTLSVQGLKRAIYEQIAAVLGVPLAQVPHRSVVISAAQLLDKWVGSSERHIARAFAEIAGLAAQKYRDAQGREVELPLLVCFEECEALGMHRRDGADGDSGVHDRILGTLLQVTDPARPEFRDHCIIMVATSNRPGAIDAALRRRLSMHTQHFGALTRRESFAAVLTRQLRDIPLADATLPDLVSDLGGWLYAREGQETMAEVSYVGTAEPAHVYRREFLTPALLNRAVQQAVERACLRQADGLVPAAVTQQELQDALNEQILAIVQLLTSSNVGEYIDVPDGVRVNTVRRVALNRPPRHQSLRPAQREVA